MPNQMIEWRYIPAAEGWEDYEPDVAVWLDVAKVDAAWRRTDQYIVPGGANGQDHRYAKVGVWFAKYSYSNMLVINLKSNGRITFTDGRHRFSWLRDHGAEAIQCQVSPAAGCKKARADAVGVSSYVDFVLCAGSTTKFCRLAKLAFIDQKPSRPYQVSIMRSGSYDILERQRAKQRSRDQDDRALRSGAVSPDELARQNGFFDGLAIHRGRIARRGSVAG